MFSSQFDQVANEYRHMEEVIQMRMKLFYGDSTQTDFEHLTDVCEQ